MRWRARDSQGFSASLIQKMVEPFGYDSRTRHGYQVFFYGYREWAETQLMRKLISDGDTVIDIGANIGWYTTLFSSLVGEKGIVLAVEPIPPTVEMLKKNLAINNCETRVRLFQGACSDYTGVLDVYDFPTLHPGLASSRPIGHYPRIAYTVPTTTVDALAQEHRLGNIKMIKIDVEGAELSVLKGGLSILRSGCVESLLLEANDERSEAFSYRFCECIDLLKQIRSDYRAFRVNSRDATLGEMKTSADYRHGQNVLILRQGGQAWKMLRALSLLDESSSLSVDAIE